ncbi:MAG: hypothetical protein ACK4P3_02755 [Fimbriimonadaceae bacterium]
MSRPVRIFLPIAALALAVALVGCEQQGREVSLPANTPIKLVTITELESGESQEGKAVQLIVEEDVVVDGTVVVPKGSLATGKVSWSRKGSATRAAINQPARLAVELQAVSTPTGSQIPISPREPREGHPNEVEFRRSNANIREAMTRMVKVVQDQEVRDSLTRLRSRLDRGNVQDMSDQENQEIADALKGLGLESAAGQLQGQSNADIEAAIALTKGDRNPSIVERGLRGLGIAGELMYLGSRAADTGGLIPGSLNIAIPIGTRVEAKTTETVSVRIP